jgi:FAD/FMN-containing dehydrogenase
MNSAANNALQTSALVHQFLAEGLQVFESGCKEYSNACRIWNGAVRHAPALVVRCTSASDVQRVVRTARAHRFPISIKGGGHDWCGRGIADSAVVLDLSGMRDIAVDRHKNEVTFSGGALAADVVAVAESAGLSVVTGYSGTIGMAGLLLGGGYGPLTTRLGLASDSLLEAQVVLDDGRLVTANESINADLLWALRGGGGNFGAVTSMRVRAHVLQTLMSGFVVFPWSDVESALRGYADMMLSAPPELSVAAVLSVAPSGAPTILLAPTWTGEPEQMKHIVARLESFGNPLMTQIGPTRIGTMLAGYDDVQVVNGRHNEVHTRWLSKLDSNVISTLKEAFESRTSRFSSVVLHHFHGAGSRVAPASTAFGMRTEHFTAIIYSTWLEDEHHDHEQHAAWGTKLSTRLSKWALPGGYANLLAPNSIEQVRAAYGGNASLLREIKLKFDPSNTFSSAIPLPG